jgi:hypothetical protein
MSATRLPRNYVGLLVIGGILALLGGSCETLGVAMTVSPADDAAQRSGVFLIAFTAVVFVVPAAVCLTLGLRARKRIARLERLDALGLAAVRMPIDAVAADLGVSAAEARDLILDAVGQGILRGRLDLEQGVFFSAEADASFRQGAVHCRRCGANAQIVLVPGQAPTCPYCHTPV